MIKDQIMLKAFDLFSQNGIKSVSMDDIAQTIGISKRTIYEFFSDKEELLCQGIIFNYDRFKIQLAAFEKESETILDAILYFYREIIKQPKCYNKKFYSDLKRYPRAMEIQERYRNEFSFTCLQYFKRGVNEGIFVPEINFEIVALIAKKYINMLEPSKSFSCHSVVEIYNTVLYTFLRGISTEKGIKIVEQYALNSHS